MSFDVLVIPEDPTLNGHILKPLAERLVADAGKPNAKVKVLDNPRLRGYDHAVRAIREQLPQRYGFFDLWLFFPDADRAGAEVMDNLEADAALDAQGITLFCCPAQPEVEIYACAAFRNQLRTTWDDARDHPRLKEQVFEPLLSRLGFERRAPGGGRKSMVVRSLQNLPLLYQLCPETRRLRDRIAAHIQARGD